MTHEPNELWTPQPAFSLDPFFETRDHANRWDMRALWSDAVPESNDAPPQPAENSDH